MTEEQIALSRRAVACRGWRWIPGARWIVTRAAPLDDYAGRIVEGGRRAPDGPGLPDLADPATLGCLLALVREAHGRCCYTQTVGGYWTVQNGDTEDAWDDHCATEAEALVAALESAP